MYYGFSSSRRCSRLGRSSRGVETHTNTRQLCWQSKRPHDVSFVFIRSISLWLKPNLTTCSGVGGLLWLPLIQLFGRAPLLFWLNTIGTVLTLGCCLVQNFAGYYGIRTLMGLCFSVNVTAGLAFIQDVYFLHEQARIIGLWTMTFLGSPYYAPLFGYFIIADTGNWRITYWMTFGLGCIIVTLCLLFLDETWYRRDIPQAEQPTRGGRLLRVIGVWQIRLGKKYFMSAVPAVRRLFRTVLKPIMIPVMAF